MEQNQLYSLNISHNFGVKMKTTLEVLRYLFLPFFILAISCAAPV